MQVKFSRDLFVSDEPTSFLLTGTQRLLAPEHCLSLLLHHSLAPPCSQVPTRKDKQPASTPALLLLPWTMSRIAPRTLVSMLVPSPELLLLTSFLKRNSKTLAACCHSTFLVVCSILDAPLFPFGPPQLLYWDSGGCLLARILQTGQLPWW